ncbi:Acetylornithine aminotransferase, mitochondrial [Capsicum annuum]|nr:Acetylornithine aminotransferase, mitochondrial [Capsicum annuum]
MVEEVSERVMGDCSTSSMSSNLSEVFHFSSGNPRIEETRGIMHLFSNNHLSSHLPVDRKQLLCVLFVPNHMTYADFCQFCGSFIQHMLEMRIVRNDGMEDCYSILIRFDEQKAADTFHKHFNGRKFSSLEEETCNVLFAADVHYTGSIEHTQSTPASSTEQPFCAVCLVAEEIVVGGNYMGVWEEGPNYWKWKSSSRETVPIPLPRNGSYDYMVRSVIESGELDCEPKNVVISYVMNERGKIHPTFIKNDRHVSLYMFDVVVDGSRPLLRINVVPGSPTISPPQPTIDEHDLFEDESLDAHPMNLKDHSMELEDPIFSEEAGEECGLGA